MHNFPFSPSGSADCVLQPELFVSVVAWSPFLTSDTRLVLCQGWPLRPDNVDDLLREVARAWTHVRRTSAMHNATVQMEVIRLKCVPVRKSCIVCFLMIFR